MKIIRRTVLVILLLLVVGGAVVYFWADSIIKSQIEKQTTAQTNLNTTLNGVTLSVLGGNLKLNQLKIASPKGFSAPNMFELGDGQVAVNYGDLRKQPVHIKQISLNSPHIVLEQADGKFNVNAAMDQMPSSASSGSSSSSSDTKYIIDQLEIANPMVTLNSGLPGVGTFDLPLPSITLKNIGNDDGAQNGAAMKDVVMQVLTSVMAKAESSDKITGKLKDLMTSNLTGLASKMTANFQKQLNGIAPNLGDLTQSLGSGHLPTSLPSNIMDNVPKNLPGNLDQKIPKFGH